MSDPTYITRITPIKIQKQVNIFSENKKGNSGFVNATYHGKRYILELSRYFKLSHVFQKYIY